MESHFLPRKSSIPAPAINYENKTLRSSGKPRFTFKRFRKELLTIFEIKPRFYDFWTNCWFLLRFAEMIVRALLTRTCKGQSAFRLVLYVSINERVLKSEGVFNCIILLEGSRKPL